ncbi:L-lactate dehydrogenase [bacterium]|nr:L-lactate dehydrogenase [bacterium]MBQ6436113.1 L-lactate dehydrogenase [bacterium]
MINQDYFKVTIVGAGKVGATAAYALLLAGFCHEIVLFGRHKEKLVGEKLDLEHAQALSAGTKITISDDYAELAGTDVFVFCAGAAQEPGETRLQLAAKNLGIVDTMVPQLLQAAPEALLLMVANPCDLMTFKAAQYGQKNRVFGSGTLLDTARFRFHLSEFLPVNARSIHAYVLGEHGDHSFPVLSSASIGGQKLTSFPGFSREQAQAAYESARDAAYAIIESKGATYYGIGASITKIVRTIWSDGRTILPLSVTLDNYYGQSGMNVSVPCVLGREGIAQVVTVELDETEQKQLADGVAVLKEVYAGVQTS